MKLQELLSEACAHSDHPVALLDRAKTILTASATFPQAWALGLNQSGGEVVLPVGDYWLVLIPTLEDSWHALEALAVEGRRRAQEAQRHASALTLALHELDTRELLGKASELLAQPDSFEARLRALSELAAARLPAAPRFALLTEPQPPAPPGETVLRAPSSAGMVASVSYPGELDAQQRDLLGALVERVASAGLRRELEQQRASAEQAHTLVELAGLLAHEINSPLAALSMSLSYGLEAGLGGAAGKELLDDAARACEQIMVIGRQLRQLGSGGRSYRRISIDELLTHVSDRAKVAEVATQAFVIAEPTRLCAALDVLRAATASVSIVVAVEQRGLVLRFEQPRMTVPQALLDLGATVTFTDPETEVHLPFRML